MPDRKPSDLATIVHRLTSKALHAEYYEGVFEDLWETLAQTGLELPRANLSMQILHPLVSSVDMNWSRPQRFEINSRGHQSAPVEGWLRRPFCWMLTNRPKE